MIARLTFMRVWLKTDPRGQIIAAAVAPLVTDPRRLRQVDLAVLND